MNWSAINERDNMIFFLVLKFYFKDSITFFTKFEGIANPYPAYEPVVEKIAVFIEEFPL